MYLWEKMLDYICLKRLKYVLLLSFPKSIRRYWKCGDERFSFYFPPNLTAGIRSVVSIYFPISISELSASNSSSGCFVIFMFMDYLRIRACYDSVIVFMTFQKCDVRGTSYIMYCYVMPVAFVSFQVPFVINSPFSSYNSIDSVCPPVPGHGYV